MPVETRISFSDGSSDAVRKLSDDLSRKHLSDLIEAEEDEVTCSLPDRPRSRRKASSASSTYSGTSMDALWEKHPRRLSEAGLRRSSDHSVVLTEDTDSFIIGERVWVGGSKPGQIAYIGETQFAPGDWAGIVLDESIGKNDGSVAGVRYFQCSEKRGVFSRLTRLTRVPLVSPSAHDASPASDAGSVFDRPPSGMARPRRTLSPNGSVRSFVSSKMNASISTTTNGELRLGDRVIVSSSRGSKAGALRYVGETDFAPGVWAGVELDDPLGKNDGSVEGKRYFECSPRFGLFAPISKVSRSPSNRKPGACAIHSNGRATPLRRSNSRESLTSLGTSIASSRIGVRLGGLGAQRMGAPRASSTPVSAKNALQELLREKQHHLERLMRERELEHSEVAKVSLQAERAETALAQLKKEASETIGENGKLKTQLDALNKLLEDERQKVEDLMFRNEEENINKEDYNKYKEAMEAEKLSREQRIRELEAEAVLQAARAEATATTLKALEDQRTAEAIALAEQHKEELTAAQALSSELQKLLDEAYALLKEKENEKDSLGKSLSEELNKLKADSEKALNEAKSKMAIAQTEFETQQSVLTAKLQLAESKLETEKQNLERLNKENSQIIIDLNAKVSQLQANVDDKTLELNKIMGSSKEHEVNLNKEITKLKMELSAKVLDIEQLEDTKRKQESSCKTLQEEISRVKDELTSKVNEYETLLNEVSQQNEKNKTEIMELQQNLSVKTKEYERLLNDSSSANTSTEKLMLEYKQTIQERDKEIIKLKNDYEEVTANFNIKHSKIAEEHKKEIDDRNTKIDQLTKEIESHKIALDQTKGEFETLNNKFTINGDELKSIREENERLKETIAELTKANNEYKSQIATMELQIGELQRQLQSSVEKCSELQNAKDKIESEYMNLTGQATDSNEQFNKLTHHLKEYEKEIQELKDKSREIANNHGRIEQELKQKLFIIQEEFSTERSEWVRTDNESVEKFKAAQNKITEFETKTKEISDRLKEVEMNNDKLIDENSVLKGDIQTLKSKELELIDEFDSIRKKLEIQIETYKEEVSLLKAEGASSEVKLMEKVDQLTEAQNDLNNKLEEARKHEGSLQKILNDTTSQLNNQKLQYDNDIIALQNQATSAAEESNKQKLEMTHLNDIIQEKQNAIKELILKLEMLEVDFKSNVEIITEKERQLAQVNEELNKALESKKVLEEKLNSSISEASALTQKYENLIANSSAEETVLKEQISQLEVLRKEISILNQDKSSLEEKYNTVCTELNSLKGQQDDTLKKLKQTEDENNNLRHTLDEKDNLLKTNSAKNESETNRLQSLEKELTSLKQEIQGKDSSLQEKEQKLANLNAALSAGANETQEIIQRLQTENSALSEKYKNEMESLNNSIKSLQNNNLEKEKELEEFQKTKEKLVQLQQLLKKSEDDIKQLTNINEGQKSNYEDLNKQLQTQYDELKKDSKRMKHDLKAKLHEYEKELNETKEKVKDETDKNNKLKETLGAAEMNVRELKKTLEVVIAQGNADADKNQNVESLKMEMQDMIKSYERNVASKEEMITSLSVDIENKTKDLQKKGDTIKKLEDDLKDYKAKVEITEREKIMLKKELSTVSKDKNDNNAVGLLGEGDSTSQKLKEEKEIVDGQVTFLNSVIVDMQRKNEQLLARVQALEGGSLSSDSPVFNGRKARAVAPRLFCDICDVFDAHDTEDCPKQAAEPDAPPPASAKKPPPPPRPYCDICEVFGHSTENCDEEETF